jgi:hypothetical protein
VASCGGNVALGGFVWLAEVSVCFPGPGDDAPQGSKGQRDRSTIHIEAWFGQCLYYTKNDDDTVMVLLNLYSKKKDVPERVKRIGMNIISGGIFLLQTNLVTNQPLTDI